MPPFTVPQRQVQPQPLPAARVRAPSGAPGAITGRLLQQVGGDISQVAGAVTDVGFKAISAEQAQIKQRAVLKDTRDKQLANEAVFGIKDTLRETTPTYLSRTGTEAIDVTSDAKNDFAAIKRIALDGLKNDEQRAYAEASLLSVEELHLNKVYSHEEKQFRQTSKDQVEARRINATRDLQDAVGTEDFATVETATTMDIENVIAVRTRGLPAEIKEVVSENIWSGYYAPVVNTMMATDARGAKEYYDLHKSQILPGQREKIEIALENEVATQDAVDFVTQLEAEGQDLNSWQRIIQESDLDKNTKAFAKELATARKQEVDNINKEAVEKNYFDAIDNIDNAESLTEGLIIANKLKDVESRTKAKKFARSRHKIKTEEIVTNRDVQAQVWEDIEAGKINNPRQLIPFKGEFSPKHYDQMIDDLKAKTSTPEKITSIEYGTAKTAFQEVLGASYVLEDHAKELIWFRSKLDEEARRLGRNLSSTEAAAFGRKLIVDTEGEILGGGYITDPDKTMFQSIKDGDFENWAPDINSKKDDDGKERDEIIKSFLGQGFIVENETLMRLYKREEILKIELSSEQSNLYDKLLARQRKTKR
jgi:hypothetical protein